MFGTGCEVPEFFGELTSGTEYAALHRSDRHVEDICCALERHAVEVDEDDRRPELLRESRECRLNIRAEFDGIELVATLRVGRIEAVSYTHLRAHETVLDLV